MKEQLDKLEENLTLIEMFEKTLNRTNKRQEDQMEREYKYFEDLQTVEIKNALEGFTGAKNRTLYQGIERLEGRYQYFGGYS
ncbi:hypothetical protein INT44_002488 [Umbelopsis vinacea]|uniref:Uncharacterized protein n=1 Tax=Umbelopsis vinacea TaxID=44442 RepID=A0A8H7Q533_9FUNG|nr:hypothetical protein INT44_002488 [Umbelopsis vinacea]